LDDLGSFAAEIILLVLAIGGFLARRIRPLWHAAKNRFVALERFDAVRVWPLVEGHHEVR
jgi:hypothetical protein